MMKNWLKGLGILFLMYLPYYFWSPGKAVESMNSKERRTWTRECLQATMGDSVPVVERDAAVDRMWEDLNDAQWDTTQALLTFSRRECPPRRIRQILTGRWVEP